MKLINLKSCAKLNLAFDLIGKLPNGYHEVRMIMQQIELCDDVCVRWVPDDSLSGVMIEVHTNKYFLPTDRRNNAYTAAEVMIEKFAGKRRGTVRIDIRKNIPVAAGLAGGSGNGAAVLHGISYLWDLGLSVSELCGIAAGLGADMPFSVMGQARVNAELGLTADPMASSCALAEGVGERLTPLLPLDSLVVVSKPKLSVSTKVVYQGMDKVFIEDRPDVDAIAAGLRGNDRAKVESNMGNVLELYTLKEYNSVLYTKCKMAENKNIGKVLMSGSGPSVYGLFTSRRDAQEAYDVMRRINDETYLTRTTV
ncbi:MAG: 4-(cytidine 5'-diphospho)-2-C-methyl-D-erythritol kinase [Eubacteriaceae bacterium]|nr:4-(cytidine 5'-diphospho)-2-C-methyl-D-erythritol kinase [Eubacteriaceae bacterium]